MNNYKVYVYAICKNEEKFALNWVNAMKEADGIYVLDTGSTDNTVERLRQLGVNVSTKIIDPWRFDVARNASLALVPEDADICVCTDLDELFHPGWRAKMEAAWERGANRLRYRYTWSFNEDGSEGAVFWISKVHARHHFEWVHPVHEVLENTKDHIIEIEAVGVQLDHHPDRQKSRAQYLPLLELAVKEKPNDDRNMHYLGREYMYYQKWDLCISTLMKHLEMKTATWKDERCASMRYIAHSYQQIGNPEEALNWALKAIAEAPYLREPWMEAADLCLDQKEWAGALYFAEKALMIVNRSKSYINEAINWSYKPYDVIAIASYYLGLYEQAYENGKKALEYEPKNERLEKNMKFYKAKMKKQN